MDGERGRWSDTTVRNATIVLSVVLVGLVAWLVWGGGSSPQPSAVATPVSPSPTPVEATTTEAPPRVTESESVAPAPTPTETPSETVLFMGGPATGPWQMIGTVSEITHPGAPESASYSYREVWSDPSEEAQPDWLWDQVTIEVAAAAVELGDPVDRPAFGGAPGSEPFNAFGGVQDIDSTRRLLTGLWNVTFEDDQGVSAASFGYLISFDNEILRREGPFVVREADVPEHQDATARAIEWLRRWSEVGG